MKVLHMVSNRWNSAICEYAVSYIKSTSGVKNYAIGLSGKAFESRANSLVEGFFPWDNFSLTKIFELRKICAEIKPDLIVTHGGPEAALTMGVSGIRVVRCKGYVQEKNLLNKIRSSLSSGNRMIYPSQFAKDSDFSHREDLVIPLGIDGTKFYYEKIDKPKRPSLLIFGRFDPVKGHVQFMKEFEKILEVYPGKLKPLLKIVGKEANISAEFLRNQAASLNLKDIEIDDRQVENVRQLMTEATIGVISSLGSEVICRVAEEFLMCGTPIWVNGAGSLQETLCFNGAGILYPRFDSTSLAQYIENAFLEEPAERARRAQAARKFFSLEAMGWLLEKV